MKELKIVVKGIVGNLEDKDIKDINDATYCVLIKADTEEDCKNIRDAIKNGEFVLEE